LSVVTRYGNVLLLNVSKPVSEAAMMVNFSILAEDDTSLGQLQAPFGLDSFALIQVPTPSAATVVEASYLYTPTPSATASSLRLALPEPLLTLSASISRRVGGAPGMLIQASYTSSSCPASNVSLALRIVQLTDMTAVTITDVASPCNGAIKLGVEQLLYGPLLLELSGDGTTIASGLGIGLPLPTLDVLEWTLQSTSVGALSDTTLALAFVVNASQVAASVPGNWTLEQLVPATICQTLMFEVAATNTATMQIEATVSKLLPRCSLLAVQAVTLANLAAFTNYSVTMRLKQGDIELATHIVFLTTKPGQPQVLESADITVVPGADSLAFSWVYPEAQWQGPAGVFAVELRTNESVVFEDSIDSLTLEITALTPYTNYTLLVSPVGLCPLCQGNTTVVTSATLAGVPDAITDLAVVNITATSAVLTWTSPADYKGLPVAIEVAVFGSETTFNLYVSRSSDPLVAALP
jgi:hypothetical protein